MKIMCPYCGSPNLNTEAACYNCSKPLQAPKQSEPKAKPVVKKKDAKDD